MIAGWKGHGVFTGRAGAHRVTALFIALMGENNFLHISNNRNHNSDGNSSTKNIEPVSGLIKCGQPATIRNLTTANTATSYLLALILETMIILILLQKYEWQSTNEGAAAFSRSMAACYLGLKIARDSGNLRFSSRMGRKRMPVLMPLVRT